ncbi:MAG: LCP family protein [Firmicutes bacterium]|nr:LCP family protein [Bacillota bacterium]
MRSERREEERRQKAAARGNRFFQVLSVIYTLILAAFIGLLIWINVLPAKYLYSLIAVLILISIFIVPVMFSRYGIRKRKTAAAFFSVILIAGFGVGAWYLADTIDFLDDITVAGSIVELKEDYYVVVKSDSAFTDVSELAGSGVGTHMTNDLTYSEAKDDLQREVSVEYKYFADLNQLFDGLAAGGCETVDETTGIAEFQEYQAVFISAASYESLKAERTSLEEETRILYTISIKVGEAGASKAVNVKKDSFNVYVSGLDVEGDIGIQSRSDVNIIVTVNPKTHEVLLTSIPRDYYVSLPGKGAQDKLTHSGLYGIQETMGAVEEMTGLTMNYYVKVNYSTVVKLVDAIGGVDVDSPYAFTTHNMKGMPELNGINFVQGINHLDGKMALAFCRERASWVDGDMRRNENQQLVLEAILKKATGSTAILTSYTSILDAIRGNMETNMSTEEMTSLVKMQLNDMPSWDIQKTALKGKNDYLPCYALGGAYASVVDQDHEQIAQAADRIIGVMNNGEE